MDEIVSKLGLMSRRRALKTAVGGLGSMALGNLLSKESGYERLFHHPPKARRVIYLFQSGGPSQMDLFDHKPALAKFHGEDIFKFVQ